MRDGLPKHYYLVVRVVRYGVVATPPAQGLLRAQEILCVSMNATITFKKMVLHVAADESDTIRHTFSWTTLAVKHATLGEK